MLLDLLQQKISYQRYNFVTSINIVVLDFNYIFLKIFFKYVGEYVLNFINLSTSLSKNLVDQIDKGINGSGGGTGSGSSTLDRSQLKPLNLSGLISKILLLLKW